MLIRKYANNLNTSKIFTSVEFDRVLILLIKQVRLSRKSLDPALKSLLKSRHTRTDTLTHVCIHLVFVVKIKAKSKQTGLNATVEMLFITMPLQLQLELPL